MSEETKQCPECAETIKAEAVLCRFCKYDFATGKGARAAAAPPPPSKGLPVVVIILIVVFGGVFVLGILSALLLPAVARATRKAKETACANNLRTLWGMQVTYMSQFGGKLKKMPEQTGEDFWLALTQTVPPLIDMSEKETLQCPCADSPGKCDYQGPAINVHRIGGGDAVGADKVSNHGGQGGNVLRKSGDVLLLEGADFHNAIQTLKP